MSATYCTVNPATAMALRLVSGRKYELLMTSGARALLLDTVTGKRENCVPVSVLLPYEKKET